MRYWVVTIETDGMEVGRGWIRAETPEAALALADHPDAAVYEIPDDLGFPKDASGSIVWTV